MVKAKTQLNLSKKVSYGDEDNESSDDSLDIEYEKFLEYERIENATAMLREKLIQYTGEGSWPLCEYLDLDNVNNYVKWVIKCK
jgi:hypothetical protein